MTSRNHIWLAAVLLVLFVITGHAQSHVRKPPTLLPDVEYDARLFLTVTERNAFRQIYPDFDEPRAEKAWEWRDVDPLGLFTPAENRQHRREQFLFEYSAVSSPEDEPATAEQLAFRTVLKTQLQNPIILIGRTSIKIATPYTERYEGKLPLRNLLEKTARLGLQWAQVGGLNLYMYNGPILLSRYKAGYVSLANRNIDQPSKRSSK